MALFGRLRNDDAGSIAKPSRTSYGSYCYVSGFRLIALSLFEGNVNVGSGD